MHGADRQPLERARVQRALRESEARKRAIVDASLDALVTIDVEGRILEWNHAAEELFGYPADEAVGRELAELIIPERFRERHRKALAAYRPGQASSVVGRRLEMTAQRADGSEFPVELAVAVVALDDPDVPLMFSSSLRDLTEQRRAQLETARLAAIVESSDDAIIGKSADGTIVSWNGGAERLYGYAAGEAVGRNIALIVPDEHLAELEELLGRVRAGEPVSHHETVRRRKDGTRVEVAVTMSPLRDVDGNVVGTSVIARSLEPVRRRLELEASLREAQRLESLGRLAGGLAHDFNNLLVGVLGNASLALASLPEGASELRTLVDEICASAEEAAALTRQLLFYVGQGGRKPESVELAEFVRDVCEQTGERFPDVAFTCTLAPPVPVVADVVALRQAVSELLENAAEACLEARTEAVPGVSVRVETVELSDAALALLVGATANLPPGRYAHVAVQDAGAGIPADVLPKIFEPFFSTKFIGRGLGLAAALGTCRRHGGALTVASTEGRGTRFTLLLPVDPGGGSS